MCYPLLIKIPSLRIHTEVSFRKHIHKFPIINIQISNFVHYAYCYLTLAEQVFTLSEGCVGRLEDKGVG